MRPRPLLEMNEPSTPTQSVPQSQGGVGQDEEGEARSLPAVDAARSEPSVGASNSRNLMQLGGPSSLRFKITMKGKGHTVSTFTLPASAEQT